MPSDVVFPVLLLLLMLSSVAVPLSLLRVLLLLVLQRGDVRLAAAEAVESLVAKGQHLQRFSFLLPTALSLATEETDAAVQQAVGEGYIKGQGLGFRTQGLCNAV